MTSRISSVRHVELISVGGSSIVHFGDSVGVTPKAKGFAVQREVATFKKDEGDFSDPLFVEPIPTPLMTEKVRMNRFNELSFINVNRLHIISVGSASIIQIGSNRFIDAEARIKNTRQFISPPSKQNEQEER
ncbi:spore germination protein GerPE [Bacillus taeanensis]|uniref:spore germination protein GerPE n=1 Tax=Bacillus taeanensis TaxID=273032 RepID=UPI0015EFF979|nr:spore germination protein GerPE [Bacillus taeanensis]